MHQNAESPKYLESARVFELPRCLNSLFPATTGMNSSIKNSIKNSVFAEKDFYFKTIISDVCEFPDCLKFPKKLLL